MVSQDLAFQIFKMFYCLENSICNCWLLYADNASDNGPSIHDKSFKSLKEEITAADMVLSEGLVSEPHPEEEIGTSNSNAGSEKSDFDSVGQETAKSMMTFLLPQAIPLLKKASRKKNTAVSPLETLPCVVHSEKQNKDINPFPPGVVS